MREEEIVLQRKDMLFLEQRILVRQLKIVFVYYINYFNNDDDNYVNNVLYVIDFLGVVLVYYGLMVKLCIKCVVFKGIILRQMFIII